MPLPARLRVPLDATLLVVAGVALSLGVFALAFLSLATPFYVGLDLVGFALACWGFGILMLFLSLAVRRVRQSPPPSDSRPRSAGLMGTARETSRRRTAGRIPLDALFLVLTGVCFLVSILILALPAFVAYTVVLPTAIYGVAYVSVGLGLMFLFLSLAARRISST